MKKYSLVATLFAIALFVGVGCGSDKTEVGWTNSSGGSIMDIQWIDQNEKANQTWSGTYANGAKTDLKEVTETTGDPKAFNPAGGAEYDLKVQDGSATGTRGYFTVDEGSSNYYTIDATY